MAPQRFFKTVWFVTGTAFASAPLFPGSEEPERSWKSRRLSNLRSWKTLCLGLGENRAESVRERRRGLWMGEVGASPHGTDWRLFPRVCVVGTAPSSTDKREWPANTEKSPLKQPRTRTQITHGISLQDNMTLTDAAKPQVSDPGQDGSHPGGSSAVLLGPVGFSWWKSFVICRTLNATELSKSKRLTFF